MSKGSVFGPGLLSCREDIRPAPPGEGPRAPPKAAFGGARVDAPHGPALSIERRGETDHSPRTGTAVVPCDGTDRTVSVKHLRRFPGSTTSRPDGHPPCSLALCPLPPSRHRAFAVVSRSSSSPRSSRSAWSRRPLRLLREDRSAARFALTARVRRWRASQCSSGRPAAPSSVAPDQLRGGLPTADPCRPVERPVHPDLPGLHRLRLRGGELERPKPLRGPRLLHAVGVVRPHRAGCLAAARRLDLGHRDGIGRGSAIWLHRARLLERDHL
jgi:hypothetical protein